MFSVRPEFPPPPAGTVRRYRSRNSNEILPSSEESPIFNTPESKHTPVQPLGQNTALLAGAGLRIATVELDRLTNYSRSAKSSLEVARASSSMESACSESESSYIADPTPAVPSNSPASFLPPQANLSTTPMVRSWSGLRSRRLIALRTHLMVVVRPCLWLRISLVKLFRTLYRILKPRGVRF